MLTKLLLTLLVILGCAVLLQLQRRRRVNAASPGDSGRGSTRLGWLLGALLALALLLGGTLTVLEWQDQRVRLEVRVINPASGEVQRYVAYRSALQGRRFTTVDGLEIQLGDSERVEVRELSAP